MKKYGLDPIEIVQWAKDAVRIFGTKKCVDGKEEKKDKEKMNNKNLRKEN